MKPQEALRSLLGAGPSSYSDDGQQEEPFTLVRAARPHGGRDCPVWRENSPQDMSKKAGGLYRSCLREGDKYEKLVAEVGRPRSMAVRL